MQNGSATLAFTGDLVFARRVNERLRTGTDPGAIWGDVRPLMAAADAVIGNLEGPLTNHKKKWHGWKAFYFRGAPEPAVAALVAGNYRCLALANNHILDFAEEGLFDTRRHLAEAGIAAAGAGATVAEAERPALFTAGDLRVGFISITNTVRSFAATADRPGTAYWKIRRSRSNLTHLAAMVHDLRRNGADVVVLSVHWGPNYRWWPPAPYRRFARAAIELGVDIVHGHSAHVLQAVEYHRKGLILYDTGDFMEDFQPGPGFRSDRTFLFLVEVHKDVPPRLRMVPVSLTPAEVNRAIGAEASAIRAGMVDRCRGYAVTITEEDGDLIALPGSSIAT